MTRLRSVTFDSMLTNWPRSSVMAPAISVATITPSVTPTNADSMLYPIPSDTKD